MKTAFSLSAVLVACAIASVGAATACSSSDDTTDDGSSGTTSGGTSGTTSGGTSGTTSGGVADGLDVSKLSAAECAYYAKCAPSVLTGFYGTTDACTTSLESNVASTKKLNGESVTQAEIDSCTAAFSGVTDCNVGVPIASCSFAGTLANGTACSDDGQCSGKLCSKTTSTTGGEATCGVCATVGAAGAACSDTAPCDDTQGLQCVSSVCTAALTSGATCTNSGLQCAQGLKCITNKCATPLAEGAACDPEDDGCGVNTTCTPETGSSTTGTCTSTTPTFVALGAACGVDATGKQTSCTASFCDTANTKTCIAFGALGAACVVDAPNCGPNLNCDPTTLKCADPTTATCTH